MKIRLIEPKSRSNNVYDHSRLPRLGLPQIGAILARQGHDVSITVEMLAPIDWDDLATADLVGISSTTATTPTAYAIADRLRAQGKPVVFGGAHVTFLPDEALEHADYVVRGEGHITMVELVEAIEKNDDPSGILGLSYHGPEGNVHNLPRPNCEQAAFVALPSPDLTLIRGHQNMVTIPIMTQWGCPYDCDFCSVIKMFGRKVRARNIEDVLDELETVKQGQDVFFYDDNFVVNKTRTKALLRQIIARGLVVPWSAQMRAEAIYKNKRTGEWDTELLELMRDSGCTWVYIGFESVNQAVLEAFNKQQTVEQIDESIRAFHAYDIPVHGMFVLGADPDTVETVRTTIDFAIEHEIDTVQFLTITPIPGTAFYERTKANGHLLSTDWELYDGHHVVIRPAQMTPYELQMESMKGMLRFYAPRRAWRLLLANLRREIPFLLRLFFRDRKVRFTLPRIALMSLLPKKWPEIPPVLQKAVDPASWRRLRGVFIIPLFRVYAYGHTRQGLRQPINKQYIAWLRSLQSLVQPRKRGEGMV
jgi:anaerobic magnesium-protoporphyrin IX monomethyl ester cyclase